jgi:hypothetical protein
MDPSPFLTNPSIGGNQVFAAGNPMNINMAHLGGQPGGIGGPRGPNQQGGGVGGNLNNGGQGGFF